MNRYTIYCTPEQTKKALELGAPIERIACHIKGYCPQRTIKIEDADKSYYCDIPTSEQMISWLEDNGIWIHFCKPNQRPTLLSYSVSNINEPFRRVFVGGEYESRKKATLAAIDDALEYLSNNAEIHNLLHRRANEEGS